MTRRRVALVATLVLLALVAVAGVIRFAPAPAEPTRASREAPLPPQAPPIAVYRRPSPKQLPADLHGIPIAEARAYAALGAFADGRDVALTLEPADQATRAQAEEDLATQAPTPGSGRAQVLPGGMTMSIAPRRKPAPATVAPRATGSPGVDLEPASVPRQVTTITLPGEVTRRDAAHVIHGRGVWAGIVLHPDDGPLRIVDEGEGGYAFTCHGSDFGTVRVNGGIVVPGRHYRIQGAVTITSAVEVGVDIVPLEAVPEYWDQPFSLPAGTG